VPVVAAAGQALGRDRPVLGPRAGLQDVEQPEAHRLLDLGVAIHLDVGAVPELVEVGPLLGQQAIPAGQVGAGQRADDLVDQGRPGPLARPAVADVLHDTQLVARSQLGRHRGPAQIRVGLGAAVHLGRAEDLVGHPRGHPQLAGARPVNQHDPGRRAVVGLVLLADQRGVQDGGQPGIVASLGHLLVGDELGLQHHPQLLVHRLNRVVDGRNGALGERHHAH
jgi:hypothetical protein